MKKIMFNDRYGLTEAVIKRRKQQTRRTLKNQSGNLAGQIKYTKKGGDLVFVRADFDNGISEDCPYAIGEIVAVAQSYKDASIDFIPNNLEQPRKWGFTHRMKAWLNKMFVYADLMPYQIRILDVRAERLQDITDDDCLREGLDHDGELPYIFDDKLAHRFYYDTPRKAFAAFINKISGKGTWNSNPYVWRIEFELIK